MVSKQDEIQAKVTDVCIIYTSILYVCITDLKYSYIVK